MAHIQTRPTETIVFQLGGDGTATDPYVLWGDKFVGQPRPVVYQLTAPGTYVWKKPAFGTYASVAVLGGGGGGAGGYGYAATAPTGKEGGYGYGGDASRAQPYAPDHPHQRYEVPLSALPDEVTVVVGAGGEGGAGGRVESGAIVTLPVGGSPGGPSWFGDLFSPGGQGGEVQRVGTGEQYRPSRSRVNLVVNPSFEVDLAGWIAWGPVSVTRVLTEHLVGEACMRVTLAATVLTNLITNPSFETSTAGWAAASGTTAFGLAGPGYVGAQCLDSGSFSATTARMYVQSAAMAASAGQQHYIKYACREIQDASKGTFTGGLRVRWYDAAGTSLAYWDSPTYNMPSTTWGVKSFKPPVAPANTASFRIFPYMIGRSGWGGTWQLDAVIVSLTDTPYFSGATADTSEWDYAWTGTANLSTSTATSVGSAVGSGALSVESVEAGKIYALSSGHKTAVTSRNISYVLSWYAGPTSVYTQLIPVGADSTAWARLGIAVTAPDGVDTLQWQIAYDTLPPSEEHYVDAVMCELADVVDGYFDGDTVDGNGWEYSWTGIPHWSASVASLAVPDFPGDGGRGGGGEIAGDLPGVGGMPGYYGLVSPDGGAPGTSIAPAGDGDAGSIWALPRGGGGGGGAGASYSTALSAYGDGAPGGRGGPGSGGGGGGAGGATGGASARGGNGGRGGDGVVTILVQ